MKEHSVILIFVLALIFSLTPVFSIHAGQALLILSNGTPMTWEADTTDPIVLAVENGSCGQFSQSDMVTRIEDNLRQWTDLDVVDLAFEVRTDLITVDVDGDNYCKFLNDVQVPGDFTQAEQDECEDQMAAAGEDGITPVLFDDDGELTDSATGENNGRFTILGFANPVVSSSDTTISEGQMVINCYCLEDGAGNPAHSDCSSAFSLEENAFTIVHEMGHALNLDHDTTNVDNVDNGNSADDDNIPTMFPYSIDAEKQITPMESDITALASLYPATNSTFFIEGDSSSTYCKVTGTFLGRYGFEARCINAEVNDGSDDFFDQSFVTGAYAPCRDNNNDGDTADSGECTGGGEGDFEFFIRPARAAGLTLSAKSINPKFIGGSGIGPCTNGQLPTCTSTIISRCERGFDTSGCQACVVEETFDSSATNDAGEIILQKIANECVAGAVVALGNITTRSISQAFTFQSRGGGGGGCSLSLVAVPGTGVAPFMAPDKRDESRYFSHAVLILIMGIGLLAGVRLMRYCATPTFSASRSRRPWA